MSMGEGSRGIHSAMKRLKIVIDLGNTGLK